MEIWKDVKGYEGLYKVSSLGNVKSLKRKKVLKERIIKSSLCGGRYLRVNLSKDGVAKTHKVHQLVSIAFLNHKPCGMDLVVNHINLNKLDNRLCNLEIVTSRVNSNMKHIKSSSKYVGVSWHKRDLVWSSAIHINGKSKHLGNYDSEYEAHLSYQNELKKIKNNE